LWKEKIETKWDGNNYREKAHFTLNPVLNWEPPPLGNVRVNDPGGELIQQEMI